MASSLNHAQTKCFTCTKGKAMYKCEGCGQSFCFPHLADHNRQIAQALDDIEDYRNIFKQTLTQYQQQPDEHLFIKRINHWEQNSIQLIQQTAQQARDTIYEYINKRVAKIDMKLNTLTNEMREYRNENDFNEIHLKYLKFELNCLQEELDRSNDIEIKEDSILIRKLDVIKAKEPKCSIDIKWNSNAITIAGGHGEGDQLNQFNMPHSITLDDDQNIYVADLWNNRIVQWKTDATEGEIVAGGNGKGSKNNQLNHPSDVIIDRTNSAFIIADRDNKRVVRWCRQNPYEGETIISNVHCICLTMNENGDLYVGDNSKHEVRRWRMGDNDGLLVAGGNGQGGRLHELNEPRCIVVDENESIYVSDTGNHRVMKWIRGAKEGIVVAGGNGKGDSLKQLSYPYGICVDQHETVYIADYMNHRIVRWLKDSTEGELVVGDCVEGDNDNQLNGPSGIAFDNENNLYVVNQENNRVQKFTVCDKKCS